MTTLFSLISPFHLILLTFPFPLSSAVSYHFSSFLPPLSSLPLLLIFSPSVFFLPPVFLPSHSALCLPYFSHSLSFPPYPPLLLPLSRIFPLHPISPLCYPDCPSSIFPPCDPFSTFFSLLILFFCSLVLLFFLFMLLLFLSASVQGIVSFIHP